MAKEGCPRASADAGLEAALAGGIEEGSMGSSAWFRGHHCSHTTRTLVPIISPSCLVAFCRKLGVFKPLRPKGEFLMLL